MNTYFFRKVGENAALRAVLLGLMGAALILVPIFEAEDLVRMLLGYVILNGILGIVSFIPVRKMKNPVMVYIDLAILGSLVLFGLLSILCFRRLVSMLPVFLGALSMIAGCVYFTAALCGGYRLRLLLAVAGLAVIFGGVWLIIFTFGFGGMRELARLFGGILLLSGGCELLVLQRTFQKVSGKTAP